MTGFSLFPKITRGLEWLAGHSDAVIQFGWNIIAAVILLFIGKFISRLLSRGLEKLLLKRKVDRTIIQFFTALVRYITLAFFVVAALGRVGIETSSIIAVIGAAGLAVGLALQGSLSNFAAGVLLVSLRPFRAGEVVIPNGKIIADNIINYSRHPFRRIDLVIGVGYQSRIADVKRVINHIIEQDSRIDKQRGVTVRLGELGASALNFYVRVCVPNIEYWNTYYDLLENIKESLDANHIDLPYPQMDIRVKNVAQELQP